MPPSAKAPTAHLPDRFGATADARRCHSGRVSETGPIEYGDELRTTWAARLSAHQRTTVDLDGRKHAAVAIVLVDSDASLHDGDPIFADGPDPDWDPTGTVPGDTTGLDGRMCHVKRPPSPWTAPRDAP